MDIKDAIQQIKMALAEVEAKGQAFVHIPALKQFLDGMEKNATTSIEAQKLQHQSNLEWYKAQNQARLEMLKSTMEAAHSALKASLIVNGGAAVALLAFVGNVWTKSQTAAVAHALATSVGWFSGGVLLAGLATFATYFTQFFYSREHKKTGIGFHIGAVGFVALSYVAFGLGVFSAYGAFLDHLVPKPPVAENAAPLNRNVQK